MRKKYNITREFLLDCFLNKKNIPDISKETNIPEHILRGICDKYAIKDQIYYKCKFCGSEDNLQSKIINNRVILHNICKLCAKSHFKTAVNFSPEKRLKIAEKRKNTCQLRYGLNGRPRTKETTERIRKTKEERYGDGKYNNLIKQQQTMIQKYGVDHSSKLDTTIKRYSKISQELFWLIYNNLSEDLQQHTYFAELNKEFSCYHKELKRGYKYDFVISNLKLCIEFNGCYWHANPLIFDLDEEDFIRSKKVKDIWAYDYIKETYIEEKYGYDFVEVWDYEYLENKQKILDDILVKINWNYKKYILKTIPI